MRLNDAQAQAVAHELRRHGDELQPSGTDQEQPLGVTPDDQAEPYRRLADQVERTGQLDLTSPRQRELVQQALATNHWRDMARDERPTALQDVMDQVERAEIPAAKPSEPAVTGEQTTAQVQAMTEEREATPVGIEERDAMMRATQDINAEAATVETWRSATREAAENGDPRDTWPNYEPRDSEAIAAAAQLRHAERASFFRTPLTPAASAGLASRMNAASARLSESSEQLRHEEKPDTDRNTTDRLVAARASLARGRDPQSIDAPLPESMIQQERENLREIS